MRSRLRVGCPGSINRAATPKFRRDSSLVPELTPVSDGSGEPRCPPSVALRAGERAGPGGHEDPLDAALEELEVRIRPQPRPGPPPPWDGAAARTHSARTCHSASSFDSHNVPPVCSPRPPAPMANGALRSRLLSGSPGVTSRATSTKFLRDCSSVQEVSPPGPSSRGWSLSGALVCHVWHITQDGSPGFSSVKPPRRLAKIGCTLDTKYSKSRPVAATTDATVASSSPVQVAVTKSATPVSGTHQAEPSRIRAPPSPPLTGRPPGSPPDRRESLPCAPAWAHTRPECA